MNQAVAFEDRSPEYRAGYERGMRDTLEAAEAANNVAPLLIPAPGRPVLTLEDFANRVAMVDESQLRTLIPYSPAEAVNVKAAAKIAGRSDTCLREWVDRYKIGRHVVGSIEVSTVALNMLLDGAAVTLARYVSGDRDHPDVVAYFARAGLPGFSE